MVLHNGSVDTLAGKQNVVRLAFIKRIELRGQQRLSMFGLRREEHVGPENMGIVEKRAWMYNRVGPRRVGFTDEFIEWC